MNGHGAKFGRMMEAPVAALLTQRNVEDAARSVGITTQTLVRWMKVPEFQKAYREARRAAFGQSIARLQQASSAAVSTLRRSWSIRVCRPRPVSVRPTAFWTTPSRRSRLRTSMLGLQNWSGLRKMRKGAGGDKSAPR